MADDRNCHHEPSLLGPLLLFPEAIIWRETEQAHMLT